MIQFPPGACRCDDFGRSDPLPAFFRTSSGLSGIDRTLLMLFLGRPGGMPAFLGEMEVGIIKIERGSRRKMGRGRRRCRNLGGRGRGKTDSRSVFNREIRLGPGEVFLRRLWCFPTPSRVRERNPCLRAGPSWDFSLIPSLRIPPAPGLQTLFLAKKRRFCHASISFARKI